MLGSILVLIGATLIFVSTIKPATVPIRDFSEFKLTHIGEQALNVKAIPFWKNQSATLGIGFRSDFKLLFDYTNRSIENQITFLKQCKLYPPTFSSYLLQEAGLLMDFLGEAQALICPTRTNVLFLVTNHYFIVISPIMVHTEAYDLVEQFFIPGKPDLDDFWYDTGEEILWNSLA